MSVAEREVQPIYGERVLVVEPYSIERIPQSERHGRAFHLFPLWLGANLTIADFALGFLPIGLGLSWGLTIAALVVGNVLGGALLSLASAMGPRTGYPQMIAGRWPFGQMGEYLPAAFNWLSTVGWFTVNNILGAFGLRVLFPNLPFAAAAICLVVVQVLLAVFGHNLIHAYERVMSVLLGALFLGVTVLALTHFHTVAAYHPAVASPPLASFAIVLAAAFSYIASWGPYASDYSRYLPPTTPVRAAFGWTFLGSVIASLWLELVGSLVAILAGPKAGNPIASLHTVMGGFGAAAVVAVILGATAADALNLYSNSLSARSLDLRVSRPILTLAAGAVGLGLSLYGSGHFMDFYQNFLLLLDYWVTPWLAVLFVDFFLLRRTTDEPLLQRVRWRGLISYLLGIAVSTPFMSSVLFTGPVAAYWGGADFSYYIGFLVAGATYWAWYAPGRLSGQRS
jgi:NCS1 family nucleobase:cation symporter-1